MRSQARASIRGEFRHLPSSRSRASSLPLAPCLSRVAPLPRGLQRCTSESRSTSTSSSSPSAPAAPAAAFPSPPLSVWSGWEGLRRQARPCRRRARQEDKPAAPRCFSTSANEPGRGDLTVAGRLPAEEGDAGQATSANELVVAGRGDLTAANELLPCAIQADDASGGLIRRASWSASGLVVLALLPPVARPATAV